MRLGLRGRLALATALVVLLAVLALWQRSRGVIADELVRLHLVLTPGALDPLAEALTGHWTRHGHWRGADSVLARAALPPPFRVLVLDARGAVAAVAEPRLRGVRIEPRADGVMLRLPPLPDGGRPLVLAEDPPRTALRDARGRPIGTLLAVPLPPPAELHAASRVRDAVERQLPWPTLVVGTVAVAVLVTAMLRLLQPLAAVAHAARRFGAGDRAARAPVAGRDEVAQLARDFNAMADAVERGERGRRQLVADVAHELRTPLTVLRAQVEALQDGLLAPDAASLRSLAEEVERLSRRVDDLQTLALAESEGLPVHCAPVPARALAEQAAQAMAAIAHAAGVSLAVCADTPARVSADAGRMGQVLHNLLANAVRHSPAGGTVRLEVAAGPEEVRLAVADSGPGLDAEQQARVFDRFWRADPSRAQATGGAGLGLAIARQLVLLHGGRITVASAPGAGARFTIHLPRVG